ncbi:hypothetical protein AMTRI_Chr09g34150 [Amborella trichopoda]
MGDMASGNLEMANELCYGISYSENTHDELIQSILELKFQNEYLKAHFTGSQGQHFGYACNIKEATENGEHITSEDFEALHEQIRTLTRQVEEHRETQNAAEDALKHLQLAYSEADAKVQELSSKLFEAQQKMDQEIKERDDKYSELDSKFGRLHKRAKQRIQELQKEKDDLEARLHEVDKKAEQTSSQHSVAQQELERTKQQASEALKSLDGERQQLRTANNRLRESVDDLHRSLEAKEHALENLQPSLIEKEQMVQEIQVLLQSSEEKQQSSIAELNAKHQKLIGSLEAQLADASSERYKASETVSSLQVLIAEKESRIAELEAASSGKAARLGAAVEAAKGEVMHLKREHEKEKESWENALQALKTKLEASEAAYLNSEIEAAKIRSQLELKLAVQNQLVSSREAELAAARDEINHLEKEFISYKARAHALLQKKDAELSAAKDTNLMKAQEAAIKEAKREVELATSERDKALQALQDAMINHENELAARNIALIDAEQRIRDMARKLDTAKSQYLVEKESWQTNLDSVEETWRLKYKALEDQVNMEARQDLQEELEELKKLYKKLKGEHDSFCDMANNMVEAKDNEISRLLSENITLQQTLEARPLVQYKDNHRNIDSLKQEVQVSTTSTAEQQILILARQQAHREEELAQCQRHILALQEEIDELEHENRLHNQQEAMLKAELRNMERAQKREGVDMTYLKNVVLKLLETGEVEALLPVVATLLQFSPEEIRKCQEASRISSDVPTTTAPTVVDGASSSPFSLFSKFSFS